MDGAARAFGAATEIDFRGRTLEVRPRVVDMWAAIEQRILSLRPDPFVLAREKMELFDGQPAAQKQLLQMAFNEVKEHRSVGGDEARDWCNSLDGVTFTFWLSVKHNPDPPAESEVKSWLLSLVDKLVDELQNAENPDSPIEARQKAQADVLDKVTEVMNKASGEDLAGN